MSSATKFAVSLGRAAAVTPGGVLVRSMDASYSTLVAYPQGVTMADVAAFDAFPSVVTMAGEAYHYSAGRWVGGGNVLAERPVAPSRGPLTIEVPGRNAAEAAEAKVWVIAEGAMAFAQAGVCEPGDRLHAHLSCARDLIGSHRARPEGEVDRKALARTGGPLSTVR